MVECAGRMTADELMEEALRQVAAVWQVEAGQIVQSESSFDWTPGSHTVRVSASKHDDGRARVRLWIETDFLRDIPIQNDSFCGVLGALAPFETSTYSLVYPPNDIWKEYRGREPAKLSLFSSAYISEQSASWLPRFAAQMAIMQPINAEIRSTPMSEILGGGTPAYAKGEKATIYNAILEIAADIDARGSAPSRWGGSEEFTTCATEYGRSDQCFGNGDPSGLTLETPFGSNSALIRLRTDRAHPQLKNGLLITVQIPFWSTPAEVTNEAAFLNFWEARSWTDFPQFGCWHLYLTGNDKAGLAHTSFVPNALYLDNLVFNLALWSVARAQWVRRERWPDLQDLTMAKILDARLGG